MDKLFIPFGTVHPPYNANGYKAPSCGQLIGRPQTFVELQLHFKLHFPSVKMQFETYKQPGTLH